MNTNQRTLSLKFTAALAVLLLAACACQADSLRATPADPGGRSRRLRGDGRLRTC